MKDVASKMRTEEQTGLIASGDVGHGFVGEALHEQSPGQADFISNIFSDCKITRAHCKKLNSIDIHKLKSARPSGCQPHLYQSSV